MHAEVVEFRKSTDTSAGTRSCSPKPVIDRTSNWPSCITQGADLGYGKPLLVDVSSLIRHPEEKRHKELIFNSEGNIGMVLRDQPHDLEEVVGDVQAGSQAQEAGVQKGWIIKEVDGKPFKKNQTLKAVGEDFAFAKKQAPTLTVKFDVRTSLDCTNGDCKKSDKFPSATQDECSEACAHIETCASWSFANEAGDFMCWLRSDVPALRPREGAVAGTRACYPASVRKYVLLFVTFVLAVVALLRWLEAPGLHVLRQALGVLGKGSHFLQGKTGLELKRYQNKLDACKDGEDELEYLMGTGSEQDGASWRMPFASKSSGNRGSGWNASSFDDDPDL